MRKALKIIGWIVGIVLLLLVVCILLARYVFRDRLLEYRYELQLEECVDLLRTAGPYRTEPAASYRFAYRQDSVRAREIRDYFRLDTLADPAASTWERSLATARFVAANIPHENQKIYPERCDATGLWEYTRSVEGAFNCRLHAILLHELLLAQGVTNRFVTCLPADSLDWDCHVVNIVWLPERRKWAMIDSDQSAFVTDPAGTPLSLAEMRERYLADAPMQVHPLLGDARDLAYYRSYWAKNLYWFSCWEETGYGREDARRKEEGRMVNLLPEGFGGFRRDRDEIATSDAERFWAAPDTLLQH